MRTRLPIDVHRKIKERAKAQGRSMTAFLHSHILLLKSFDFMSGNTNKTPYIDTSFSFTDEDVFLLDNLAKWLETTRMGAIQFVARESIKDTGGIFDAPKDDTR